MKVGPYENLTISCSGKDITIACDDHDTKQAVMDALTGDGEPVGYVSPRTIGALKTPEGAGTVVACAGFDTTIPLYAALRPSQAAAVLPAASADAVREALLQATWQEILDKDDRNSPEEYPEMVMITQEELRDYMQRAALAGPPELENEKLREALKPFAEAASNFTCTIGPDGIDDGVTVAARLHGRPEREATLSSADFSRAIRALRREG